jgi:hypothetical protein
MNAQPLMPVCISERALAEIEAAALTFESLRAGHGAAFKFAIDAILDAVAAHPHLYQRVGRHPSVRRAVVQRFGFVVVYLVAEDSVTVLAVLPSRSRTDRVPSSLSS